MALEINIGTDAEVITSTLNDAIYEVVHVAAMWQ